MEDRAPQRLSRLALFAVSAALCGFASPSFAATVLVAFALLLGCTWPRFRRAIVPFLGGLGLLVVRASGGRVQELVPALSPLLTLVILLAGLVVLGRSSVSR